MQVAEYVAAPANYLLVSRQCCAGIMAWLFCAVAQQCTASFLPLQLDLSFTVESQIKFKCLNTYEYASWHYWYILTNGGIVMNIDFLAGGTRDHPFWDLADPTGNRFGDVPGGRMLVRVYLFNSKVEFRAIYCTRNTIVTIP